MTINLKKALFILALFVFIGSISTKAVYASPRLYLEPASGSYNLGDPFEVKVKIDTNDIETMAADAMINFDQNRLKVNQVTKGDFYADTSYDIESSNGRLTIYSFNTQALVSSSGVGDIATISFEAIGEGTAAVSFLCESGAAGASSIWDTEYNDVIDCSAVGSGSYEIGGTTQPDPDPTPEPQPDPEPETESEVPTPTPSVLPETGMEIPLIIAGIGGLIMLLLSGLLAL